MIRDDIPFVLPPISIFSGFGFDGEYSFSIFSMRCWALLCCLSHYCSEYDVFMAPDFPEKLLGVSAPELTGGRLRADDRSADP